MAKKRQKTGPKNRSIRKRNKPEKAELLTRTKADALRVVLPGGIYLGNVLQNLPGCLSEIDGTIQYMNDIIKAMNPKDPMEQMLCEQLVLCHHRAAYLQGQAMRQKTLNCIRTMNELADRAMNAYRRSMLALQDYRAPRRPSQLIVAKQVNQAESQQVALVENENPKNEK